MAINKNSHARPGHSTAAPVVAPLPHLDTTGGTEMLRQQRLRVSLVMLIDGFPWPSEPATWPRGRPTTYADRLILQALVLMIICHLETAYA